MQPERKNKLLFLFNKGGGGGLWWCIFVYHVSCVGLISDRTLQFLYSSVSLRPLLQATGSRMYRLDSDKYTPHTQLKKRIFVWLMYRALNHDNRNHLSGIALNVALCRISCLHGAGGARGLEAYRVDIKGFTFLAAMPLLSGCLCCVSRNSSSTRPCVPA